MNPTPDPANRPSVATDSNGNYPRVTYFTSEDGTSQRFVIGFPGVELTLTPSSAVKLSDRIIACMRYDLSPAPTPTGVSGKTNLGGDAPTPGKIDGSTACTKDAQAAGVAYPRTCPICKLGPCQKHPPSAHPPAAQPVDGAEACMDPHEPKRHLASIIAERDTLGAQLKEAREERDSVGARVVELRKVLQKSEKYMAGESDDNMAVSAGRILDKTAADYAHLTTIAKSDLAKLEQDEKRLDWLTGNVHWIQDRQKSANILTYSFDAPLFDGVSSINIRARIDAALSVQPSADRREPAP